MTSSSTRFDACASEYARGRPGYPDALAPVLESLGVVAGARVADIGAGSGQFTRWLLQRGVIVDAVEPSAAMRAEAARSLGARSGLTLVAGSAEQTTLPDGSVDAITAAQAFHWFRTDETRAEWRRILKPDGVVILLWNTRRTDDDLGAELDALFREFGEGYDAIGHSGPRRQALIEAFFEATHQTADNPFVLDAPGFQAFLDSISYLPANGHPRRAACRAALDAVFATHAHDGRIVLQMVTDVHSGRLRS